MTSLIIAATIALAIPLGATAANTIAHWSRTRPQTSGNRQIPGKLSVRGLIDEAFATAAAFLGPLAALAPAAAPSDDRPASLAILHESPWAAASWLLVRRLRAAGWHVALFNAPAQPTPPQAAANLAQQILAKLGDKRSVTLVGIGGAGLPARQLAATDPRFTRVVTVATPHRGSFSRAFRASLRPQSTYLADIAEADPPARSFDAVALYSDGDAWLEPTTAAYYPGAFNLEIHDIGHLSMLFSRRVFGYIEENLASPISPDGR